VNGKKFAFHQIPVGILTDHMQNLIGNGCVVHLPSLETELAQLDGTSIEWKSKRK
jgi:adenylosuccinate synthase